MLKNIRSLLYVPSENRRLQKSLQLKADALCYDLEDSIQDKDQARENLFKFLNENKIDKNYFIRINPVNSEFYKDDIKKIRQFYRGNKIQIVIPKLEDDVQLIKIQNDFKDYNLEMMALIETPLAFINLQKICLINQELKLIKGLIFGSDDLAAKLNAIRSESSQELLYCRQKLILYSKAFNLNAIDMVNIHYKDQQKLQKECIEGYNFGFDGKQCIHPEQLETVHKFFKPNEDQIQWAKSIIQSYESQKDGAISLNMGKQTMIDAPTYKQALNIMNQI